MSDQENKTPVDQKPATDTKTNPPVAIDSATPKAPVPAAAPATATEPEKERKQA